MPAPVPTELEELLEFESPECSCGRVHRVETRWVELGSGVLERIVSMAYRIGGGLRVGLVADRVTFEIAGERVERWLAADDHRVSTLLLPDGAGGRAHADEATVALVERGLAECDLAVAVGAGTVNDVTKLASFGRGIPYLVVATAPSMNGYTSGIAAVMIRGVKRTVECHQPLGVVADLEILRRAPLDLIRAGLGDLESKPTCTADFRLAGRLRGEWYCSAPEEVVMRAERRAADAAEGIGRGDPQAVGVLTEALLLSGFSMRLAGTSSPASGGEHLLSHHWDMLAEDEGRVEHWHGAQVGVATIVIAALYDRLARIDPRRLDLDGILSARQSEEAFVAALRARHGERADEVVPEALSKRLSDDALREELADCVANWDDIWSNLRQVLRPAARVRRILSAAGAPTTMSDIGLTPGHLERSFLAAREIRGRFTVLDWADDLGVLGAVRDEVLRASGCSA